MDGSHVTDMNAVSFAFGLHTTTVVPEPMQW